MWPTVKAPTSTGVPINRCDEQLRCDSFSILPVCSVELCVWGGGGGNDKPSLEATTQNIRDLEKKRIFAQGLHPRNHPGCNNSLR